MRFCWVRVYAVCSAHNKTLLRFWISIPASQPYLHMADFFLSKRKRDGNGKIFGEMGFYCKWTTGKFNLLKMVDKVPTSWIRTDWKWKCLKVEMYTKIEKYWVKWGFKLMSHLKMEINAWIKSKSKRAYLESFVANVLIMNVVLRYCGTAKRKLSTKPKRCF